MMDYFDILVLMEAKSPNAISTIIDKYGDELHERIKKDNRQSDLEVGDLLNLMMEVDPTKNSAYLNWIIREYLSSRIRYIEDLSKLSPMLSRFEELKRVIDPAQRDIGRYKFNQLWEFIQSQSDTETTSENEKERRLEKEFIDSGEAVILRNDSDVKIIIPKSERASCFFGRNTQWCTASTDSENHFERYNHIGDLIIVLFKKQNRRYQLHFEEMQFMNENDDPMTVKEMKAVFELLPSTLTDDLKGNIAFDIITGNIKSKDIIEQLNEEHELTYISPKYDFVRSVINYMPEDIQKYMIEILGSDIRLITRPSRELILAAIKNQPGSIQYVKNQTEEMQRLALDKAELRQSPYRYFENPSQDITMYALYIDGLNIRFVENPTEEMYLEAVKENPNAIRFIENPSNDVQVEAVSRDRHVFYQIKNPSPEADRIYDAGIK